MKILYFIDFIHTPGGMERVLSLKANYLVEQFGYEVGVVSLSAEREAFFPFHPAIKIFALGLRDQYEHTTQFQKIFQGKYYATRHKKAVLQIINDFKPHVCCSFFGLEFYFLHEIKDGSKKIVEFHNSKESLLMLASQERFGYLKKIYRKWNIRQIRKIAKNYDYTITLSVRDKESWNFANTLVIPNPNTFKDNGLYQNDYTQKSVVSVGRVSYQKAFDLLIETWKIVHQQFPDWTLTIQGRRKNTIDNLDELIQKANLQEVINVLSTTDDIVKVYYDHSIFVLSSRYEGFGMVLTEAATCGLPMVSFDCPSGPSEIITAGSDGYLAEAENVQDLAQKLMLLMQDTEKRKIFGQQARKNVKRFDIQLIMYKWYELFENIVHK